MRGGRHKCPGPAWPSLDGQSTHGRWTGGVGIWGGSFDDDVMLWNDVRTAVDTPEPRWEPSLITTHHHTCRHQIQTIGICTVSHAGDHRQRFKHFCIIIQKISKFKFFFFSFNIFKHYRKLNNVLSSSMNRHRSKILFEGIEPVKIKYLLSRSANEIRRSRPKPG